MFQCGSQTDNSEIMPRREDVEKMVRACWELSAGYLMLSDRHVEGMLRVIVESGDDEIQLCSYNDER